MALFGQPMPLEIEEWEIWHTYTTYLESSAIDLRKAAYRLAASGIADCAMLCTGESYWRSENSVGSGSTIIEIDFSSGRFSFRLKLAEGCRRPEGFALEAWGQASYFLMSEQRVLGQNSTLPAPYVRAYLGKCVLSFAGSEKTLNLYPILIVYESGVLIIEFRMIGPKTTTKLPNFITGGVNLFNYQFERVEVNPSLARLATRAYYESAPNWNLIRRFQLMRLQAGHDLAVVQQTRKESDADFSFELSPLSAPEPDDLKSIALTIFHTAAFVISGPRTGLRFLLLGQVPSPTIGDYWSGRPHIHLVRFSGQCQTASRNEAKHGADFGKILCRVSTLDDAEAKSALPKDARMFEDYSAYLSSACSLWVWSLDGLLSQEPWMDPNRGNLIYDRQVLAEIIEYGYMLHRSLYDRVEKFGTTSQVISVRREIIQLQRRMREVSHSGEIRDLIDTGWNKLDLASLISETDALLQLRESETRSMEALRSTRLGWALTVIFGFVAVPALADQVILPIWKLSPFHQFTDSSLMAVVSDGISVVVVLFFLLTTLLAVSYKKE